MIRRSKPPEKLSDQMMKRVLLRMRNVKQTQYDYSTKTISTGSTLLDLAISGGRFHGGGIPAGILVEIFGPASTGKTVLLCEIAGNVQRQGGQVMFYDPEARLNKQFAKLFGLNVDGLNYSNPSTVPEIFKPVRKWEPEPKDGKIHGVFADSLAALSTEMELDDKDNYGMRRAKEFSEELRKTCRTVTEKGFLIVCSNQVRQNLDAGPFGQKYKTPGGEAIGFYASLRLRCSSPKKIKQESTVNGKTVTRVVGVETEVEVFKSSIDKPFRTAGLTIIFDYGIDDVSRNLQFIKDHTSNAMYEIPYSDKKSRSYRSILDAVVAVETEGLERQLRENVIDLWEMIDKKFESKRKGKHQEGEIASDADR